MEELIMSRLSTDSYVPRRWQIIVTIILVLALASLYIPGVWLYDYGTSQALYEYFSYGRIYTHPDSSTWCFVDFSPLAFIITILFMIGGIATIWMNMPKFTLMCSSMYFLDELLYINYCINGNEFYDASTADTGFFIYSFLFIALLVFCVIALKQVKPGTRPTKATSNSDLHQKIGFADELVKYKQLLDSGVISHEEFEKAKKFYLVNKE